MAWTEFKDAGKIAFSQGNFDLALSSYLNALEELTSEERRDGSDKSNDKQILLSNVVACRLKIGGDAMTTQAVEEAKQCIALNNQWPKAHIRLASAYIALGGRSNDACQSLQRAISLDRSNKVAREMLIREMRGRDNNERNNGSGSTGNSSDGGDPSSHTPEEETSHPNRAEQQSPSHNSSNRNNTDGIDVDDIDQPSSYESISERFQYYVTKSVTWYQNQSEDMQTILKVSFALLILYVALGGRFGLEYVFQKQRRGNYGHGNAYERYNSAARSSDSYGYVSESSSANRAQRRTESSGYNDRTNPQNNQYYSRYSQHDDEQYYEPRQTRGSRRSTTFHMPNLFDGSFTSLIILFIISTICHRFGVNPFQVFWILQAMQRGGRHHHGYGGYGGFGGGFGRRRVRRGRW
mmetsp:Transcript_5626/g.9226  ORF Transcript_5626/g.9226 Transcript_5626/m.9226 type:complete len:408 (-) Transcript_5626:940-2163(-)